MVKSVISTILKHEEAIEIADVAKGVKVLLKRCSQAVEEAGKVFIWINEKLLVIAFRRQ